MLKRVAFSDRVLAAQRSDAPLRLLPDVTVIKLGGQSIIDRGAAAVLPLIQVLRNVREPLVICTGGGTRARHAYHLGVELGLPTGVLARLGAAVAKQNARMVQMLLADRGGVYVPDELFEQLPAFVRSGQLPVLAGMPPYGYWTTPPAAGRIPEYRTDAGSFLTAEAIGARAMIYVKDEDGMYATDPKKDPSAELFGDLSVDQLRQMDLPDLIVERCLLDLLQGAHLLREVRIVNGLRPELLARALAGEQTGVRIYA
ncbi:MAG: hypothetical protein P9M14_11255 [Candidatus Alcyoniella australis]|nr:hypothetical protein [Candidatus Alcyoniella australis]